MGTQRKIDLTAKIEPFDTFWEGPEDVEKGYERFSRFYKANYFKYLPSDPTARVLVVCCGPGYFVHMLNQEGYRNVTGIDSDEEKIGHARAHNLSCQVAYAFDFLESNSDPYDLIFVEQEINHLTKSEILAFMDLCRKNLNTGGTLIVHSLNGANPITGSEALAQNFDHYNTFTSYSLEQVLSSKQFHSIQIIPLKLYIFYENPLNYIGLSIDFILNTLFYLFFVFYGKNNRIFAKKIAGICRK